MSEHGDRLHGLEDVRWNTGAGLRIDVPDDQGHVNLRLDPSRDSLLEAAAGILDQKLPLTPNTTTSGTHRVFWLGPDEWHVTTAASGVAPLVSELVAALSGHCAAVNEQSGGWVTLRLSGERSREILAAGCTLDLHPRAFPVAACAQSAIAGVGALICLEDDHPTFSVTVRRSFARHFALWLRTVADDLEAWRDARR